jgi:hypothetical protein
VSGAAGAMMSQGRPERTRNRVRRNVPDANGCDVSQALAA